jgi:glycosyltransferase involved in cell wall biosynthesis
MASVQLLLERWVPDDVDLYVYPTFVEGGVAARLRATLLGVGGAVWRLLTERVDVVHVNLSKKASVLRKGVILSVARHRGVATVVHAHAGLFLDWFDGLPRPARTLVQRLLVADRVVALNETVRDGYASRLGVPMEQMLLMSNPVEWPSDIPDRSGSGPVVAAFLGYFREMKGIFDLVRAVSLLPPEQREHFRLVAAGHGDPEPVRAAVRQAGCADAVEVREYLPPPERDALLAQTGILVLPSYAEGLPMSVLEAMAWGVAPVVTPVGGLGDLIRDGHNGVLVPVGEPDALASALSKLLVDGEARRRMGAQAREDVHVFAAEPWAARLVELWRSLAADHDTARSDGTVAIR